MIRYFHRADGRLVPRFFDAGDAIPRRIRCDDGKVAAYRFEDNIPSDKPAAVEAWRRGIESAACGVAPEDARDMQRLVKERTGRMVDWNFRSGDPIFHSRADQDAVALTRGLQNRNY